MIVNTSVAFKVHDLLHRKLTSTDSRKDILASFDHILKELNEFGDGVKRFAELCVIRVRSK